MSEIKDLTEKIIKFRDERDWKQFHNPKDLALSLIMEAAELLEHFQWKNKEEMEEHVKTHAQDIGEELADIFYWILLMSRDLDIDIKQALEKKMKKNGEKYPVEKAKGRHTKHDRL